MKVLPVLGQHSGVSGYWRKMQECGIAEDHDHPQYVVVLGGDGTFLGAERMYYKLGVPFVGVGFGRVNFLLNRGITMPETFVQYMFKDQWITFSIQGIDVRIVTKEGIKNEIAFNDVYLKSSDPTRVVRLKMATKEWGEVVVEGDGVIVATPQGSTAYNRSAGGVILPLDSMQWCVTGICSRTIMHSTVSHQTIIITPNSEKIVAVTDNAIFHDVQKVILMPSEHHVTICFDAKENFEKRRHES